MVRFDVEPSSRPTESRGRKTAVASMHRIAARKVAPVDGRGREAPIKPGRFAPIAPCMLTLPHG